MMGVFAEFERAMIQERVRAGLRRAVSEGKQLGRPRISAETSPHLPSSRIRSTAPPINGDSDRQGTRGARPRPRRRSLALSASGGACERAVDSHHGVRRHAKPLGNLPHARPARGRQRLPDALF
jgi:hypothetical protein